MKRIVISILLLVLIIGGYFGYDVYNKLFQPNTPSTLSNEFVYIPTNSTFEEVVDYLDKEGFILNKSSFEWVANQMEYPKNPMRPGRFKVTPNMSNRALISKLRGGSQAPIRIAVHNKWSIDDVAGLFSNYLEKDSIDFQRVFQDEAFLSEFGLKKETAMTAFIPDSYDFYWTETPEKVFSKMLTYRDKFWNKDRLAKAKALNLTPAEVYTLASIVEKETLKNDEKDRVAGVYLNRLRKGMRLEADPTAKFASGNYKLNRVLLSHLEIVSPYNTYQNAGLPPGPIYMSSKSSIDKTLDVEDHNYIYFCAKPGGTGYHNFAVSYNQHLVNAAKYHAYARKMRAEKRRKKQQKKQ